MYTFGVGQPSLRNVATAQNSVGVCANFGNAAVSPTRIPETSVGSTGHLPVMAHTPGRPAVDFARMFDTYEFAKAIIGKTDIKSIAKLLQVNRNIHAMIKEIIGEEKRFLQDKFDSGAWMLDRNETIGALRVKERQVVQTHKCLTSRTPVSPKMIDRSIVESGPNQWIDARSGGRLYIQWDWGDANQWDWDDASQRDRDDAKKKTYAGTSTGKVIHENAGNFYPTALFAGGTLVIGYEDGKKIIRRVVDWERLCELPTDPRDISVRNNSREELDKRWEAVSFDSHRLLCFYDAGPLAGTIEVYNYLASVCSMQWFHPGMQFHPSRKSRIQSKKFLVTLGTQRKVARLWEFGCSEMKHEINIGSPVIDMVLTHHHLHAKCENNGLGIWRSFLIADGKFSKNLSDEMNADGGAVNTGMFSDGTLVVQKDNSETANRPDEFLSTNFCIFAPNGEKIKTFQHLFPRPLFACPPVIFMDTFIVTYSQFSDAHIWTKEGELSQSIKFPFDTINLIDAGFGRLWATEETLETVHMGKTICECTWGDETRETE